MITQASSGRQQTENNNAAEVAENQPPALNIPKRPVVLNQNRVKFRNALENEGGTTLEKLSIWKANMVTIAINEESSTRLPLNDDAEPIHTAVKLNLFQIIQHIHLPN